ncbi:Atu1372/SO_1960 family protein [Paraburkholderia ferrariae]|uniref:Atu1372/SO_1960 family protein n=2 Tax=Paraburkholderia TaxID=1822464 RepID=A0ABU9S5J6_9BURK
MPISVSLWPPRRNRSATTRPEGFLEQPAVLDAASDLFAAVLGEKAGHARSAFSHARLPLDLPVELVVIAQILPA